MEKVRDVIQYKHYFEEFLLAQPTKVQDKIFKVIEIIETYQRVPSTYLKAIAGTRGLMKPESNWVLIFGGFSAFSTRGNWLSS
jgi:hypothetical protein